jgi:transcriptional regulator with XRE-family HTH domain
LGKKMKIGNKIRKIREFKNISSQDMADRMNMSLQGYGRIERDEVSINVERLLEVAGIFDMKPEDVLSFDEKVVFNNYGEIKDNAGVCQSVNNGTYTGFPAEIKELYEKQIKLLEEQVELLKEKVKNLENK